MQTGSSSIGTLRTGRSTSPLLISVALHQTPAALLAGRFRESRISEYTKEHGNSVTREISPRICPWISVNLAREMSPSAFNVVKHNLFQRSTPQ